MTKNVEFYRNVAKKFIATHSRAEGDEKYICRVFQAMCGAYVREGGLFRSLHHKDYARKICGLGDSINFDALETVKSAGAPRLKQGGDFYNLLQGLSHEFPGGGLQGLSRSLPVAWGTSLEAISTETYVQDRAKHAAAASARGPRRVRESDAVVESRRDALLLGPGKRVQDPGASHGSPLADDDLCGC